MFKSTESSFEIVEYSEKIQERLDKLELNQQQRIAAAALTLSFVMKEQGLTYLEIDLGEVKIMAMAMAKKTTHQGATIH